MSIPADPYPEPMTSRAWVLDEQAVYAIAVAAADWRPGYPPTLAPGWGWIKPAEQSPPWPALPTD